MANERRDHPVLGPAYTIVRELGGGGMSRVFVARELALEREVVVKVLTPELAETLSTARFTREIKLAAALQEPHIVPVLAAGATPDGFAYYTMPFIRGESLRARISVSSLPLVEAIAILRDVARALQYAHAHGIVHRDIKPENILLSSGTAMVTDFGIAKALSAAREEGRSTSAGTAGSALTSMGMSLGTPAYMSPEQAAGDAEVDQRADIYAWGIVAWEILGGRHPFSDRATAQRLIAAHISERPPLLTGVPAAQAKLVMRCLEKDPSHRPHSAAELLAGLDASTPHASARRLRLVIGAAAALAMLGILGVFAWRSGWGGASGVPASASSQPRSVGVTTFTNLSGDKGTEYFSEGVTQEIADALGRVPGLRIAIHHPTTPTAEADPRALSRALRVQTVLQGTVQRDRNRVRVTARLVNGDDGFQMWSAKFDRELTNVFALQDDVARAIVSKLQLTLTPSARDALVRVVTTDPEAHDLFLEGTFLLNRRGAENIYKSIRLFERALQREPKFARAWAGIGLAYAVVVTWDDVDVAATLDKAVSAAHKALAIDSTTSDAWTALARAHAGRFQSRAASTAYERALALDPNSATAHQWYGELLAHLGRFSEGLVYIHRAQQLAPLSLVVNTQEGRVELQARHFERARNALNHVLTLDSTYHTAHTLLGGVYLQQGHHSRAIDEFKRSMSYTNSRRTLNMSLLGHAYAVTGKADSARMIVAEMEQRRRAGEPVSHAGLGLIYFTLGERARGLAEIDTGVSKFDVLIQMHNHEAIFDPVRRDPRGAAILARAER